MVSRMKTPRIWSGAMLERIKPNRGDREYFIWKAEDFENLVEIRPHTIFWVVLHSFREGIADILIRILRPVHRFYCSLGRIKSGELVDATLDNRELQELRSRLRIVKRSSLVRMAKGKFSIMGRVDG